MKLIYDGPGGVLRLEDGTEVPRGGEFETTQANAARLLRLQSVKVTKAPAGTTANTKKED